MKILCVIDSLGSGGAQRQIVNLACGLKAKGHHVEMFIYFPHETFFRPLIDSAGIPVHGVSKGRGFSFRVLWHLITLLRNGFFDSVISFLNSPNIYCEIAWMVSPRFRLIVGERSCKETDGSLLAAFLRRLMHIVSDYVVANSESHTNWLRRLPWLRKKACVIYNGYAITSQLHCDAISSRGRFRYLVVGRADSGKNGVRLIEALVLYLRRQGTCPLVSWAGRREIDAGGRVVSGEMDRLLAQHPEIAANWNWLGERDDIPQLLAAHDALVHPSLYEGLPNAVCEAFIAGRPVIASNVCDHPSLVKDGLRGVLCDPFSAESICAAIEQFESLSAGERNQMGINARKYAENNLSIERMVAAYEELLQGPTTI